MTTRIHVDAHAGWDVKVTVEQVTATGWIAHTSIVKKFTSQDFYVHDGMRLARIEEIHE